MKALKSLAIASTLLVAAGAQADVVANYTAKCSVCHAIGIAGAPKFGDAAAWADRVTKDQETLYSNAINGFQGSTGVMPAKGGFSDLSDDDVKALVDYMIENVK